MNKNLRIISDFLLKLYFRETEAWFPLHEVSTIVWVSRDQINM